MPVSQGKETRMPWRTARSLLGLRSQLNAAYPKRSKLSDGFIGDLRHRLDNPGSKHFPNSAGVVCAGDFTHDPIHGVDINRLSDLIAASRDPRLSYMIANRLIMVTTGRNAWVWMPYYGSNPHDKHIHVEVKDAMADKAGAWRIAPLIKPIPKPVPKPVPATDGADMDQNSPVTGAADVKFPDGTPTSTITRPLKWWLAAPYAHIIGLEKQVAELETKVDALLVLMTPKKGTP